MAMRLNLSDRHWGDLGTALKRIHTAVVPPALIRRIQQETYSPQWREIVKTFLERVENDAFADPVAVKLAAFLKARRDEIFDLSGVLNDSLWHFRLDLQNSFCVILIFTPAIS